MREVDGLRSETLYRGGLHLVSGQAGNLPAVCADCLEIDLRMPAQAQGNLVFHLRASADFEQETLVSYDFGSGTLTVDTTRSGVGRRGMTTVEAPVVGGKLDLRMFIDRSSLEIFACGGRYAITSRIYPDPASRYCDLTAAGADITVDSLQIYRQ